MLFLMMEYFDFHHHNRATEKGIYNLSFPELPREGLFSAGIHPQEISSGNESRWKWLHEVSQHPNCVAIGECGLDGRVPDEKVQSEAFSRQTELANDLCKPMIIHCVRQFSHLIPYRKKVRVPMVVHGFSKKQSVAEELRKHDFYLSFGKSVLQNVNLQRLVKDFPTEKMFLETDADEGGIDELYRLVSNLKGIFEEALIHQIEKNLQAIMPR